MEKRVVAAIIVAMVIALLLINSYYLMQVDDEPYMARVTFFNDGSQLFSVRCDIADEPEERSRGLMDRDDLKDDRGMLFVYETPQNMSFWMKNTLIPLDIIFIDEDLRVINVEEADVEAPGTPDSELPLYKSAAPAKWVVEINQGISSERGISPGTLVEIEIP